MSSSGSSGTRSPATARHWIHALAPGGEGDGTLEVELPGFRVRLRSRDAGLLEELGRYYREFPAPGDGGVDEAASVAVDVEIRLAEREPPEVELPFRPWDIDRPPGRRKNSFVDLPGGRMVRKERTGMHFVQAGPVAAVVGPCREHRNQIVNFLNRLYMGRQVEQSALPCHAGAAALDGRGVVLAGDSGVGKSTLTLRTVGGGADFVSNDRVLAMGGGNGAGRMRGVPKLPRVNPGTLLGDPALRDLLGEERRRELAGMPTEELWGLEEKYDVPIGDVFGPDRIRHGAPFSALVILGWNAGEEAPPRFEPVDLGDRPEALEVVRKDPGVFYPGPREHLTPERYRERLGRVPVWELRGGVDFDAAAERLMDFLREGSAPGGAA